MSTARKRRGQSAARMLPKDRLHVSMENISFHSILNVAGTDSFDSAMNSVLLQHSGYLQHILKQNQAGNA